MKKIIGLSALMAIIMMAVFGCEPQGFEPADDGKVSAISVKEAVYVGTGTPFMQISLKDNETLQLNVVLLPRNAKNQKVTFTHKRTDLMEVSQSGLITAKAVGKDVLTVKSDDGSVAVDYQVDIISHLVKATAIAPSAGEKIIKTGSVFDVASLLDFTPSDVWDKTLVCESDNQAVIAVNDSGVATALKEGEAKLTATTYYTIDGRPISVSFKVKIMDVLVYDLDRKGWSVTPSHSIPVDDAIKNAAGSLIDGDNTTCLSMVKPGKSYNEISKIPDEDAVGFILDMKSELRFNHFRIDHRAGNTVTYLRVWAVRLYGSNDGETYTPLTASDIDIPNVANSAVLTSGNVQIGDGSVVSYRYLKVSYALWDTGSGSTMQISEFNLGLAEAGE
jgi:hypothetical protein